MKEIPGAQTPWSEINRLLRPEERFALQQGKLKSYLLAPAETSKLAALLFLLKQQELAVHVRGTGNRLSQIFDNQVYVSARALTEIIFHEQGFVEVEAGCSFYRLQQVLFDNKVEVALEPTHLGSSKNSVAGLLLSDRFESIRLHKESLAEGLRCVDWISFEGSRMRWDSIGVPLHKLIPGMQSFPGVIVRLELKTVPVPDLRLSLSWKMKTLEEAMEQYQALLSISNSWEYLECVHSGNPLDQAYVFAQTSGLSEEMEEFSLICPRFVSAQQRNERALIKDFLRKRELSSYQVSVDYPVKPGEYLWIQDRRGRSGALLYTSQRISEDNVVPEWKKRLFESMVEC